MNSQQVRYFLAICDERNFTRAAKTCGIRQPSLTGAIRRLERELGGALFVRSTPTELTPLGAALRPFFTQIEETVERARQSAAAQTKLSRLDLRLNAS